MNQDDLYEQLSERIMTKGSKIIPELFRIAVDEEEARIMLAIPGTADHLAELLGISVDEMEKKLAGLFRKGLIFKKETPEGTLYRMCRDIVQFHDASILWPEAPQEYLDLWKRHTKEEWPDFAAMVSQMLPKPFSRVIPVQQPVEARNQVLAYEDVEEIINGSDRVAVANCTCRLVDGKCGKPLEVCLQVGKAAVYTIERGSGREVSKEEAMDIIRKSEEAGLVHVTMNRTDDYHYICNCCDDCCVAFGLMIKDRGRFNICDPSRFVAVVIEEKCNGCGTCLDRCFFDALELVEKDGEEVSNVDRELCMGCGLCQVTCPEEAISMHEARSPDFIPSY
ncbi:MAG: 4Fe-4S binding protein [Actinomycetota bacterium]|nr:4Fe-4S binding protein [Actinomycetota bacterium]